MSFGGLILTNKGRNEIAAAMSEGRALEFTHIALGDGLFSGSFMSKTALTNQAMLIKITKVERQDDNVIIHCDWNSKQASKGFYLREIGIIGNDVLCYYDNAGNDAEYIDPDSNEVVKQKRMRFTLLISSETNIVTYISSSLYATNEDLEMHKNNSENPHGVTKKQIGLGNIDNTADKDKPVSIAMQTALNGKAAATHNHAISDISSLQTTLDSKAGATHTHGNAGFSTSGFLSGDMYTRLYDLVRTDVANTGNGSGAAMGESYGRALRLSETMAQAGLSTDKYFFGIGMSGRGYTATGLNGNIATWRGLAFKSEVDALTESGTFTPVFYSTSSTQVTPTVRICKYQRVYNMVYIKAVFNFSAPQSFYSLNSAPFIAKGADSYDYTYGSISIIDGTTTSYNNRNVVVGPDGVISNRNFSATDKSATWILDGWYNIA